MGCFSLHSRGRGASNALSLAGVVRPFYVLCLQPASGAPGLRAVGRIVPLTQLPLPQRDREILKGIKPRGPRTYPMRKGENIQDVMKARGITEAEARPLAPPVEKRSPQFFSLCPQPARLGGRADRPPACADPFCTAFSASFDPIRLLHASPPLAHTRRVCSAT